MRAVVDWPPRATNQKASELDNGTWSAFNPRHCLEVVPSALRWDLFPDAPDVGRVAESTYLKAKTEGRVP